MRLTRLFVDAYLGCKLSEERDIVMHFEGLCSHIAAQAAEIERLKKFEQAQTMSRSMARRLLAQTGGDDA